MTSENDLPHEVYAFERDCGELSSASRVEPETTALPNHGSADDVENTGACARKLGALPNALRGKDSEVDVPRTAARERGGADARQNEGNCDGNVYRHDDISGRV